ncbi:MAG: DUF6107 family protein, partial [Rhizobiaceae bacterium]
GAKLAGAISGSAISLAFMVPVSKREAALRFAVGTVSGLLFGGVAGLMLASELGLTGQIGTLELMLTGSALASLCAWWGLGVAARLARQWSQDRNGEARNEH